ncbi:MAG: BMP family protein [Gemmatimonadaceae bacterium]
MLLKVRRHAKLLTSLHMVMLIVCAQGSCGRKDSASSGTNSSFRVALLTPGPISDQAWNGGAYAGLLRIRDSLGAQTSHIQTRSPTDFDENFRLYGVQGYDLVFGHGFEFQDAASRVGPSFPKTVYITTSGSRTGPNVAPMVFAFEEPSYLAGMLAGMLTKTNVISAIGGTELPPVKSSFEAYEAGARAVNADVRVIISYVGNWEDASAGKEQALAQISQGADFIFQNADAAGLGIFQAARETKKAYVFGANSNQTAVAPDVVVASVVIDLPHAFLTVAREVKEHTFTPRTIYLGTKDDVTRLEINDRMKMVTPGVRAAIDSAQRAIVAGTLKLSHPQIAR